MSDYRQAEENEMQRYDEEKRVQENIAKALVKAQTAFGSALKSSTNPHFKSRYADLAACVEAVIDALNSNGIALVQKTHEDSTGVTVETIFIHETGDMFSAGRLHVPATKHDAQGFGSALTYARRYSLMAACAIAPEDDDGNAAVKAQPKPIVNKRRLEIEQIVVALRDNYEDTEDPDHALEESKKLWGSLSDEEKRYVWNMPPFTPTALSTKRKSELSYEEKAYLKSLKVEMKA
jgi:hypothetical protein